MSEDEERAFWAVHDSADYVDQSLLKIFLAERLAYERRRKTG